MDGVELELHICVVLERVGMRCLRCVVVTRLD